MKLGWIFTCKLYSRRHAHVKKVVHTSEFPFGIYWWALKNLKNQNFEKIKKKKITGDIIILLMCTKSHNHMKYSSWDTDLDKKILSFWAIFCPFTPTPLQSRKPTFWKNEKSIWRCHHFKLLQQKTQSYDVCLLRYGVQQT